MRVLKFGGTSVGSVKSIRNIETIVGAKGVPTIVVVSALGGVTDMLLKTSQLASEGNQEYLEFFEKIIIRHYDIINEVIRDEKDRQELLAEENVLLEELKSIFQGVYLIHDLSEKTQAAIVSYGERLSSRIFAKLIPGARLHDSRQFIKTERKEGKTRLANELTRELIWKEFSPENLEGHVHIVPGFISSDKNTGETTNLGRGGSDYTAAIIAADLNAEALEIWTDVDGFMTADPRIIPTAYTIETLSYLEATELCNFGAKVVYPPTIYPVCVKNIPIYVKNTFNPDGPCTVIQNKSTYYDRRPIKGISSISGTSLITVAGLSMVGVIGVNRRIFSALTHSGISVFMVCQASSENSTSIGVRDQDAYKAAEVLNEEFAKEIATGAMYPMQVESGLAAIGVVGENMKHTPGIAGKLFGTLGRSGISMLAFTMGASETNISFVVESKYLRKSLNTIHDSFFLSEYKELNLFLCGVGTVGSKLIEMIRQQRESLMHKHRLKLNVVGIASSRKSVFSREGIDLANYREILEQCEPSNVEKIKNGVIGMNIFNSVFVDCTSSKEVADLYQSFLDHNVNIVAANKTAASSPYDIYRSLKETALTRGIKFLYETNVGAGLPIISTINDLTSSGDKILKIEAILSGTLNFIFNEIAEGVPFSVAVRRAKELGFSEPDPRIDLSGMDVVRKILILTREAGYPVEINQVDRKPLLPQELFDGTLEEFWEKLPNYDKEFEQQRIRLKEEGKRLRYAARMEMGRMSVGLQAVEATHPLYGLEGSNNIVLITTERYNKYPMQIQGYGAGAAVTAAGVFANIMSTAHN